MYFIAEVEGYFVWVTLIMSQISGNESAERYQIIMEELIYPLPLGSIYFMTTLIWPFGKL